MPPDLAQKLRRAAANSGRSHADLARATGIPQPTITRFIIVADMLLTFAAKLAVFLGLELTPAAASAAPAARKPAKKAGKAK